MEQRAAEIARSVELVLDTLPRGASPIRAWRWRTRPGTDPGHTEAGAPAAASSAGGRLSVHASMAWPRRPARYVSLVLAKELGRTMMT